VFNLKIRKMKNLVIMLLAVVVFTTAGNANEVGKRKKTVTFNVNMTCENCVAKVEKNIAFEKGVKDMKVNLEAKTVEVTFLEKKTNEEKLNAAFKKLGFTSSVAEAACCGEEEKTEAACCGEEEKAEAACCSEKEIK